MDLYNVKKYFFLIPQLPFALTCLSYIHKKHPVFVHNVNF